MAILYFLSLDVMILVYFPSRWYKSHHPVDRALSVVGTCAKLRAAEQTERRIRLLQQLDSELRSVERTVRHAWRRRGTVGRWSPLRKEFQNHSGRVVKYLRDQEARLGREDPSVVVSDIADALVSIAENYAAGQMGALLPDELVKDLVAPRDWELLRLSAVLLAALGTGVGAHLLGMTDIAAWLGAGVLIFGLIITFRHDFRKYISIFPGGGFAP
ncbi:hypothetical protein [Streptomyces alfalfae]